MTQVKKSYFAIIPANVRYDRDLPPNAKLLYGEITALCNEKGYCWAENKYFSELYGVSKTSISRWISALVEKGYIQTRLIYKEGSKEIDKRYITIVNDPIEENVNTPIKNVNDPIEENVKDNNTFNNTFNNTVNKKERKKAPTTYDAILADIADEPLRETYYDFIKMRKLIKKPLTDRALKLIIDKVNKLYPGDVVMQQKALEQSIQNSWQGVFPVKEQQNYNRGGEKYGNPFLQMLNDEDDLTGNPFM